MADGVESTESAYVEGLVNLASDHPGIFHSLIGLSWVEGDIGQLEWAVIERIGDIAYYDVALAERVATLPWIGDGIVQPEPDCQFSWSLGRRFSRTSSHPGSAVS